MRCCVEPDFRRYIRGREQNSEPLYREYIQHLNALGKRPADVIARIPDFELAWQYLYRVAHAHSGIPASSFYDFRWTINKLTPVINRINDPKYIGMLKRVKRFTCLDFEQVIKELDWPQVIFL
jgi:hypothetical protein